MAAILAGVNPNAPGEGKRIRGSSPPSAAWPSAAPTMAPNGPPMANPATPPMIFPRYPMPRG